MGETDESQNEIYLSHSKSVLSTGVCAMSMSFIAVGNEELGKVGRTGSLIFSECQATRGREGGEGEQWSNLPVSPCWGRLGEYEDTGRFSGDTSVFAHTQTTPTIFKCIVYGLLHLSSSVSLILGIALSKSAACAIGQDAARMSCSSTVELLSYRQVV